MLVSSSRCITDPEKGQTDGISVLGKQLGMSTSGKNFKDWFLSSFGRSTVISWWNHLRS